MSGRIHLCFRNAWNLASSASYLFTLFIQKSLNGGKSQDIIKSFGEKTVKDECLFLEQIIRQKKSLMPDFKEKHPITVKIFQLLQKCGTSQLDDIVSMVKPPQSPPKYHQLLPHLYWRLVNNHINPPRPSFVLVLCDLLHDLSPAADLL